MVTDAIHTFSHIIPYRRFVDSKILPLDMTERERVSTDPQICDLWVKLSEALLAEERPKSPKTEVLT